MVCASLSIRSFTIGILRRSLLISWIIKSSSQSSEVARKFLLISRNWILLGFFLIHFWHFEGILHRGVWTAEISHPPWGIWSFGLVCAYWSRSWQWIYFLAFLNFALLHLSKMYERHKRRYSLCDISKVDRTVDVVLLKVRGGNASCIMKLSRLFSLFEYSSSVSGLPHWEECWESLCQQGNVGGWVWDS